ncbi:cytochrome b5 domain-containing protein 1 [Rhincodon typus]|uniref:cytochrome b5 domain-containing protein 1 n=1 Tax=Rhincodon typus TaxID=259920 RepID=UPI0009A46386|nr:cytochrome b5 domain-containing protein 1 [Rhincodon typus]
MATEEAAVAGGEKHPATVLHSRYYSSREVAVHNTMNDLWVSYLGKVYDLTPLAEQFKGDILLRPILEAAGQDISHWFDEKRKDIRIKIDQLTNCQKYHTPRGRFAHIPPLMPMSDWCNAFGTPWWKDPKYEVGYLTEKTRDIRIINTLTGQEQVIEVCSEETVNDILERYLEYNAHAASYTWKYDGVPLKMDKTLEENGIVDEDETFYDLQMEPDDYRQSILLYFNDDLTVL